MNMNRRILVVDDNVSIHDDFRKALSAQQDATKPALSALEDKLFGGKQDAPKKSQAADVSYQIESAYQGQEALAMVEKAVQEDKPYSVVFMDVRMPPGWDGIQTIKRIWEKFPETQMVLCTAYSDYSSDDIVSNLGDTGNLLFIKKPFDVVTVRQTALALTTKWGLAKKAKEYVQDLEKTVAERTSELLQAAKMSALGEMAGGIAHEINTPLSVITTCSGQLQELLKEDPLDMPSLLSLASEIEKTGFRIAKIITGLRTFSRDGSQDQFVSTPIKTIVDDTMVFCTERFKNREVRLIVESLPEGLAVDCRPTQIGQVLLNLLNNACDAIEKQQEKWVRISARADGEDVELSITDSGPGIPEKVRVKLFQPFFTTKEVGKGTGLGLSISRGILESHKGNLSIDANCPNTRFLIRIPMKRK